MLEDVDRLYFLFGFRHLLHPYAISITIRTV